MATVRVDVKPALLRWARQRARIAASELAKAFPDLAAWEAGDRRPTLKQLERYAKRTHAPIGFFFLPEPPDEQLPIPDFRTNRSESIARPSADLLDTIYLCQQRQDWYREYAGTNAADRLPFVGSVAPESDVVATAASIRASLGLDLHVRRSVRTWEEALAQMVVNAEDLGVLVMRNGVVGNNTHRPLDRDEFRGFALSDRFAPLVFVNAADSKSGQMFTLAHELVHVFADSSGVSDSSPRRAADVGVERWYNAVAAELLVPLAGSSDDFHATEAVRVSRRFATALIGSTLEGQTLYRDAFRLLGISKTQTFKDFSASLGMVA